MAYFLCDLPTTRRPAMKIDPRIFAIALEQKNWTIESKPFSAPGSKEEFIDYILSEALDLMKKGLLLQFVMAAKSKAVLRFMKDTNTPPSKDLSPQL